MILQFCWPAVPSLVPFFVQLFQTAIFWHVRSPQNEFFLNPSRVFFEWRKRLFFPAQVKSTSSATEIYFPRAKKLCGQTALKRKARMFEDNILLELLYVNKRSLLAVWPGVVLHKLSSLFRFCIHICTF